MDPGMGHWGMWPPAPLFLWLWATAPERSAKESLLQAAGAIRHTGWDQGVSRCG